MRALSAAREKKVSWRRRARIQRSTICTATSIFGLSRGFAGPGGQDHGAVVLRELLVGPLQPRLVAAREGDAALELIADHGGGDAAKELEGPLMAREPVGDLLGAGRFGVGVVRGAEDGDEQLDLDHLAGGGVDESGFLPGVVDEALVAGVVDLAHRPAPAVQPLPVALTELGVAIAVFDARQKWTTYAWQK